MNLYFRLLLTFLKVWGQAPVHALETTTTRFRVWPWDIDAFGHMNNGRYLQIMDVARLDWMCRAGVARVCLKNWWSAAIGGHMIRFRRALAPFRSYRVRTRLVSWDPRWFFIEHLFENLRGDLIARSVSRAALCRRRRCVPTSKVVAAVSPGLPRPALPATIAAWLKADALMDELSLQPRPPEMGTRPTRSIQQKAPAYVAIPSLVPKSR